MSHFVGHRSPKLPSRGGTPVEVSRAIRMIADGVSDAVSESFTLASGTVRTVISTVDITAIHEDSIICFMAENTAAAGTPIFVESKGNGTFTAGHDKYSGTRIFSVSWQG